MHDVSTAKLVLKAHSRWVPSKVPHCFWNVREASRKHGSTVRRLKQKNLVQKRRCIYNSCSIPLFGSTARIHVKNPLDSLSVQPLNYVHNSTSPTTIKRKKYHTCKDVLIPVHVKMAAVSLLIKRNEGCRGCRLQTLASQKVGEATYSGQLFNTHFTTDM